MKAFRFSARSYAPQPAPERQSREVFRRFFDLIERLERPRREEAGKGAWPAPEVKARISRLDDAPRRNA